MVLRRHAEFGPFWGCSRYPACRGIHGAHSDGRPKGIPANKETRQERIRAHEAFDVLWRNGYLARGAAYKWLQEALGLEREEECHIGRFDLATCRRVVSLCHAKLLDLDAKRKEKPRT